MKKKVLTLLLALVVSFNVSAYDFSVDGICYDLIEKDGVKSAKVVSSRPRYSGNVVIPSTVIYNGVSYRVTTIGNSAFTYCDNITSITLPNSITTLEEASFYDCTSSFALVIPNSVTSIGLEAFKKCSGITSIKFGNSVKTIGDGAFSGCSKIKSITIPKSVTSIDGNAFDRCASLESIVVESGNKYYDSRNNCNAIINTENDELITGCMNTIIPNDISFIGYGAFYGCTGLTSIVLPPSIFSIGRHAFSGCSNLVSLHIPKRLTSIYENAFTDCSGLSQITVDPENYQYDSRNDCNAIIDKKINSLILGCKNTMIPHDITIIAQNAFKGCSGLTSITIPENIISIERSAFQDCRSLVSLDLPNNLTTLSSSIFAGCTNLRSIIIPNSVTNIGGAVFEDCNSLTSIIIPSNVTKIGVRVFDGCSSLKSIIVESSNTAFDSRNNCNAIIEKKTNSLISGCKNTMIPSDVVSIGNYAFTAIKSLSTIVIPDNISSIGTYAFEDCDNLTNVTVNNLNPVSIEKYTFTNRSNATLYVPKGSVSAYANAEYWKEFADIKEISDYVFGDANGDGKVTVADYTAIAHYIMGKAPANFNEKAADVNGDGKINVADYTAAAHLILYGTVEKPK